ncbi:hypothetical protein HK100_004633, partial [Physocladia obscura]
KMGLKVLIIGAGNAGPLLALYLQRAGHNPVIYDLFDPARVAERDVPLYFGDVGGAITIATNGQRVLDDARLLDAARAKGSEPFTTTVFSKIDGSAPVALTNFSGNRNATNADGSPAPFYLPFTIMRMHLQRAVGMACNEAGVKYLLRKKLVRIEERRDGVTAFFTDGTSDSGDILVGAEGVHSVTRKAVFGDEYKEVFANIITHVGITELGKGKGLNGEDLDLDNVLTFFNDRTSNHATAFFKTAPNNSAWQILEVNLPAPERVEDDWRPVSDLPKESKRLAILLEAWGGMKDHVEIVRAARRITSTPLYVFQRLPSFYKGRVVLIGDAAHASLPYLGQGGSMALEDAGTLGVLLTELGNDWQTAFRLYNQVRMPRVKRVLDQVEIMKNMSNAWYGHFIVRMIGFAARYLGSLDRITSYDFLDATKAALEKEKTKK